MCCPAGEHVNTEGEKNFLQAAFPTVLKPLQLHMEGRRREGEQRKSEADEEEGNEGCRRMEKVLDGRGKKEGEEESGWPEKKQD